MKTILTALKEGSVVSTGDTIAKALGGTTIAAGIHSSTTVVYTVSFDLNTGTGTEPASVVGEVGDSVTLPDGTGITAPEGKEFKGWGETADATEALESYTISEDATLYAVYATVVSGTG